LPKTGSSGTANEHSEEGVMDLRPNSQPHGGFKDENDVHT
jgi:hypothetical protein